MNKLATSFVPDWTRASTFAANVFAADVFKDERADKRRNGEIIVIAKASRFLEGSLTGLSWIPKVSRPTRDLRLKSSAVGAGIRHLLIQLSYRYASLRRDLYPKLG
jgi:hypothetical protein